MGKGSTARVDRSRYSSIKKRKEERMPTETFIYLIGLFATLIIVWNRRRSQFLYILTIFGVLSTVTFAGFFYVDAFELRATNHDLAVGYLSVAALGTAFTFIYWFLKTQTDIGRDRLSEPEWVTWYEYTLGICTPALVMVAVTGIAGRILGPHAGLGLFISVSCFTWSYAFFRASTEYVRRLYVWCLLSLTAGIFLMVMSLILLL